MSFDHVTPELVSYCLELATTDQLVRELRKRPISMAFVGISARDRYERYAWSQELHPSQVVTLCMALYELLANHEKKLEAGKPLHYSGDLEYGFEGTEPV